MKGRGDLDQHLEKKPGLTLGSDPDLFPCLVSVPVQLGVEEVDPLPVQLDRLGQSSFAQIASVYSVVVAVPPMSRVLVSPSARTSRIA